MPGRPIRPGTGGWPRHCCGGTQQLTITVGTGHSDRAVIRGAGWNGHTGTLSIEGWDANISALWSVSVTSTGRVLISNQPNRTTYPIDGTVIVQKGTGYPCPSPGATSP